MTPDRSSLDSVEDMRGAVGRLGVFLAGIRCEEFREDGKTAYAMIPAWEVLGGAAEDIPEASRQPYFAVPWRQIAGMRDELSPHDFGIDLAVVWRTATQDVPPLAPVLDDVVSRRGDQL